MEAGLDEEVLPHHPAVGEDVPDVLHHRDEGHGGDEEDGSPLQGGRGEGGEGDPGGLPHGGEVHPAEEEGEEVARPHPHEHRDHLEEAAEEDGARHGPQEGEDGEESVLARHLHRHRGQGEADDHDHGAAHQVGTVALALGALGVVYGDIGTSPLYAFQAAFNDVFGLSTNREEVLGLLSLFIWTLVLVVTVKYILVIMRADNEGEGGTLALGVLALRYVQQRHRVVVIVISMLAISLFAADGILTPSISVLSAIEGLSMVMPGVSRFEDDIALAILAVLFLAQRFGTGKIGHVFGPIMLLWFAAIAALGVRAIIPPLQPSAS